MTTPPTPGPVAPIASLRILAGSLCAAPAIILLAMYFVLGVEPDAFSPPVWAPVVPLALGVVLGATAVTVGFRAAPVHPSTPPQEAAATGAQTFQSLMILRFALCEAPMIVGLAVGFVVSEGGFLVVLVGCLVTLALLLALTLPSGWQVDRVQAALEADGARVPLDDHLQGRPTS